MLQNAHCGEKSGPTSETGDPGGFSPRLKKHNPALNWGGWIAKVFFVLTTL